MKKTEKSEVLMVRARRLKCNTSSHQAVTSPCICPPGNPTLGTGDTNGDTLLCLYNFVWRQMKEHVRIQNINFANSSRKLMLVPTDGDFSCIEPAYIVTPKVTLTLQWL